MKKLLLIIFSCFVIGVGCSTNTESTADGVWNYQDGYVAAKDEANMQVLVVRAKVEGVDQSYPAQATADSIKIK